MGKVKMSAYLSNSGEQIKEGDHICVQNGKTEMVYLVIYDSYDLHFTVTNIYTNHTLPLSNIMSKKTGVRIVTVKYQILDKIS